MVLTIDWGSANAGQIALLGTIDGVDLAGLSADVLDHDHVLSGNVSNTTCSGMECIDSAGGKSFNTAWTNTEPGSDSFGAATGTDVHNHPVGTLATSNTGTSTAMSPKNNDEITIASANGDLVCDLIDGIAPEVLYDRYDGNTHTVGGSTANRTLPAVQVYGPGGKSYFRVASDAAGNGEQWDQARTGPGTHNHANSNIQLQGDSAPAGGGSDDAGEPKFAVAHATGNVSLKGDVNNIGIAQFKANYDAHNNHATVGTTANYGQSDAQIRGIASGKTYFEISAGVWKTAFMRRLPHSHGGGALVVATPT